MCRIISFVSAKGGLGKTSIINMLGQSLSANGFSVCLFDGVFSLNSLSKIYDYNGAVDFSKYIYGDAGTYSATNKVNENLYFVKTDNPYFDYYQGAELFKKFIEEISFKFDYILIDTNSLDLKNLSLFLNLSTEVFLITNAETEVVKNSYKLLQKIHFYKNITNKKLIINNSKIITEFKGKILSSERVSSCLKTELLFIFPKFLKYNIFNFKKRSIYFNEFSNKFCRAVVSNTFIKTNYSKKYFGAFGWLNRFIDKKYE